MTNSKESKIWRVRVEGRDMAEFMEFPESLTEKEALEQAKKRFHPMPNLYVPGDAHPFKIEVFESEKED